MPELTQTHPPDEVYAPRSHEHEGRVLQVVARGMGVHVGTEEAMYWRAASKIVAALDGIVDEEHKDVIDTEFERVVAGQQIGAPGVMSAKNAEEVSEVYARLPEERKAAWERWVYLPQYSARKLGSKTVAELISVNFDEATLFADGFRLDTANRVDGDARSNFNIWLGHFARTGYMIDSSLDMPNDYNRGLIAVLPTPRHRLSMLLAAKADMKKCILLRPRALTELGKTGLATVKERKR